MRSLACRGCRRPHRLFQNMAFKSDQTSSAVSSPAVRSWIGAAGGGRGAGRRRRERGEVGSSPAVLCAGKLHPGASACPASLGTRALLCPLCPLPPALLSPAAEGGGSHGTQLPGDSTFTRRRLINPTGPALDRSVCAPLQSHQSHFLTRLLLLGINQPKKGARPGAFCSILLNSPADSHLIFLIL